MIIIEIVFITVLLLLCLSIKKIPQNFLGIVESKGNFKRVLQPGIHFILPFNEKVKESIQTKEVSFIPNPFQIKDKHNIQYTLHVICTYDVSNPVFYYYQKEKIEKEITTVLQELITSYYKSFTTEEILFLPFDQYGKIKKELQKNMLKHQLLIVDLRSLHLDKPL